MMRLLTLAVAILLLCVGCVSTLTWSIRPIQLTVGE